MSPTTLDLYVGDSATLTATFQPANATNKALRLSSSNPAVASVASDPLGAAVTAHSAGSATITLTTEVGGFSATCDVRVKMGVNIPVTGVSLNQNTLSLGAGGASAPLTATVQPTNATNQAVTWSSDNPAVATVANGVVTPLAVGAATITATTVDGGFSDTCAVTVISIPVTSVSVNPANLYMYVLDTHRLIATVAPANATNQGVTWSSGNPAVASVDADGLVTAVGAGFAFITATTDDGGFTAVCGVTVVVRITGVSLDQNTLSFTEGDAPATLTATVTPANATQKGVTWTSSNEAVATVVDGLVTPLAAGTATITVTTVDGGFQAACTVTVAPAPIPVTGVTLNQNTLILTAGSATGTLTATVQPANATDPNVTWSSSNNTVATVANGVVTPLAAGNATITVTTVDGGFQATCTVTVAPHVPVTGVTVSPVYILLGLNETATIIATVQPLHATNQNVTWDSSDNSIAIVADGVVTPVAAGTTSITATTVDGSFVANCTVHVARKYAVTMTNTDGRGTASASPAPAPAGVQVTITATPNDPSRYRLTTWRVQSSGVTLSSYSSSPANFTMPANDVEILAEFGPTTDLQYVNEIAQMLTGFTPFSSRNTPTTLYFDAVFSSPLPSSCTANFLSTVPPLGPGTDPIVGGLTLNTAMVVEAPDLSNVILTYTVTDTGGSSGTITSDPFTINISSLFGPTTVAYVLRTNVRAVQTLDNYDIVLWGGATNYTFPIILPPGVLVGSAFAETTGLPPGVTSASMQSVGSALQIQVDAAPTGPGTFTFPSVEVDYGGTSYTIDSITITLQ